MPVLVPSGTAGPWHGSSRKGVRDPLLSLLCLGVLEAGGAPERVHRITEPGTLEKPLRSSCPACDQTPPCQAEHGTECNVQLFFEHLQGWCLHPGQPILMFNYPLHKENFPNVQPKPPLEPVQAVSSSSVASLTLTCQEERGHP